ncbi:MAG: signal recognition particle protein [Spirochaetota bacterium]|nr:signal recognition particle protein [Spirochaetota bacterium]
MLDKITDRFENIFKSLRRQNRLSEKNISEGIREIKLALLEADVNYKVVKDFIKVVEEEALGEEVLKSVTPTDQFIKVVHDKLVDIMGGEDTEINLKKKDISVILMVGLQGSGKTTTCAKLGKYLKDKQRVLLVGADTYRPAAKDQLKVLAGQAELGFFSGENNDKPVDICRKALRYAKDQDYHAIIIDSAGRLQIDKPLMDELVSIKKITEPDEILFVSDSTAGQNIVDVVKEFDRILNISGVILSKFDSDTRGGAALSIRKTTGKSIKFVGTGEKIDNFERFYPDRVAGRILGRGDIVSFVEKAQAAVDTDEAAKLQEKFLKSKFDLNDFLTQIKQIKKMGSLQSIIDMLPIKKDMKNQSIDDKNLIRTEAIILSMTPKERGNVRILNGSRRRRIANGSGTKIQDVNKLLKQFDEMQKVMKKVRKNPHSLKNLFGGVKDLSNIKI